MKHSKSYIAFISQQYYLYYFCRSFYSRLADEVPVLVSVEDMRRCADSEMESGCRYKGAVITYHVLT